MSFPEGENSLIESLKVCYKSPSFEKSDLLYFSMFVFAAFFSW